MVPDWPEHLLGQVERFVGARPAAVAPDAGARVFCRKV